MIHPPRPPLVLRVGVVGHRPNRLEEAEIPALEGRLREILDTIQSEVQALHREEAALYAADPAVVRGLSPLAEGIDRLFAEQALGLGYELTVVLPFAQAEFERDFCPEQALEPDSIGRFRNLLGRAHGIFQLDGTRHDESHSYHTAGDVVLNQSDLLVVVWDGVRRNLRGGTEQTFDDAVHRGVPIVWIDAHAPHHWRLVKQPIHRLEEIRQGIRAALTRSHCFDALRREVRRLLESPINASAAGHNPEEDGQRRALALFLGERQPSWNLAIWWKWFREIIGSSHWWPPSIVVTPYELDLGGSWQRDAGEPMASLIERLRPYYAWSDKLADRYADNYRSAFVIAFGLAAFAVAMALAPLGLNLPEHGAGEALCAIAEATAICLILLIVIAGRRGRWHRRWLDYRLLAEMLRHQRLVASLGGRRASPSVPDHWGGYGDIGASWMAWYSRAVERWLGLPNVIVDREYLEACLNDLARQLDGPEGQIQFHEHTASRAHRIEHRLHVAEMVLLGATLACCLQHLAQALFHGWPHIPGQLLTFCCGFFPAFGAALAGIGNQAEFRRLSQRSRAMAERLRQELSEIQSLQARLHNTAEVRGSLSAEIARRASGTARIMVNEVLDWRILFEDQPLRTT